MTNLLYCQLLMGQQLKGKKKVKTIVIILTVFFFFNFLQIDQFLSALRDRGVTEVNLTQMVEDKVKKKILDYITTL